MTPNGDPNAGDPIQVRGATQSMTRAFLGANVHPKVVSERLGHATAGITLDTYSHVLPNLQEEAARKIEGKDGEPGRAPSHPLAAKRCCVS